jgi:transposase InsO family protein
VYPYLLRNLVIDRPNQVWATDLTYIPMARGFVYLVAIMDWYSRWVHAWRVSNTLDTSFCVEALNEAIETCGTPAIFNADQGCQFMSEDFTDVLNQHDIRISMDGKGLWVDNVFVERLWRSVKYEEVYLRAYDSIGDARASLDRYFAFYNAKCRHQSLDRQADTGQCVLPTRCQNGSMTRGRTYRAVQFLGSTSDNGREFADHEGMANDLDARIYFAHPYASWERGLNKNTNGLIRQHFPEHRYLTTVTPRELKRPWINSITVRERWASGHPTKSYSIPGLLEPLHFKVESAIAFLQKRSTIKP